MMTGFEQYDRDTFVSLIAGLGYETTVAQQMAADYEAANTAAHGEPAGGWKFDDYDLADVQRQAESAASAAATPDELAHAIARVVSECRSQSATDEPLEAAIARTRAELDIDDIDELATEGEDSVPWMGAELAQAYRRVLAATSQALTPDVAAHAQRLLDQHPRADADSPTDTNHSGSS